MDPVFDVFRDRDKVVHATQGSYEALLSPEVKGLTVQERLLVAGSNGQFSEPQMQDFYTRIAVPGLTGRIEVRPYLEVGVAYRAEDPGGFARFIAMEHAARQPDAPAQPLRTPNTFAKVATIRTPTLILMGGADMLAPPALMRTWSRHLPDKRFAEIGDAGHSINWERPDDFNHLMIQFLRQH